MSWRHPTEQDWDRSRDYLKHEPRPTDPLPARFHVPMSSALETAVLIKGMKDPREAAKLVDQYAGTKAAAVPLDRRFALASIIGACEALVKSGMLGEELESKLRVNIAEVLVAFNMPSQIEREASDAQA